jgi:CubicO group peptidase (beta-lactamase class C family)
MNYELRAASPTLESMSSRLSRLVLCLAAGSLWWAAAVEAHPFGHLRQQILAEIDSGEVPAFAVAVIADGRIIWEEGFGWIDDDELVPVSPHTPFSLASVSKPITATALMALVRRGEIDLDRPIEDYLGGLRITGHGGDPSRATVRRVASHTAGLPIHFRFFEEGLEQPPVEETVGRYALIAHPPGTRYHYSNLGYRLLERSLEVVAGDPLAEVIRREVFVPLGMTDSGLPSDGEIDGRPVAPRTGRDGKPLTFYHSDHPGGSDIYASVHDLVRFAALHLGTLLPDQEEILDSRSRGAMRRPGLPRLREPEHYAVGWVVEGDRPANTVIRMTGGMPGTRTALYLLPQRRVAVAALVSGESDLAIRVAQRVMSYYRRHLPVEERRVGSASRQGGRSRNAPARLRGRWDGSLFIAGNEVPLSLAIDRGGEAGLRLGSGEGTTVSRSRYGRRELVGWVSRIDLPSDDLPRGGGAVQLELRLEHGQLRGVAIAHGRDGADLPFALAHWVELVRDPGRRRSRPRAASPPANL